MEGLGQRLRAFARQIGLTDAEVARRAGLDSRRYGHYVRDLHEPSLSTLIQIAKVLRTTPDGLLLPDKHDGNYSERDELIARLIANAKTLSLDELRLAVHQLEAFLLFREMNRQNSNKEDGPTIIET